MNADELVTIFYITPAGRQFTRENVPYRRLLYNYTYYAAQTYVLVTDSRGVVVYQRGIKY